MKRVIINLVYNVEALSIKKNDILSIGEKIKRLRAYKGIKLKDISNEKLSISKINSIENNKINPDKNSLEILADKLGTTYEYLSKDIVTQIRENILLLNEDKSLNVLEDYKYNLYFAFKYNLSNLIFDICHNIFKRFVFECSFINNKWDFLDIIPIYFECIEKIGDINKNVIYYLDLAIYFLKIREYNLSSYYFKFLRVNCWEYREVDEFKEFILINEIRCYINLRKYNKIYNFKDKIEFYMENSKEYIYRKEFKYANVLLTIKYSFKDFNKGFVLESFKDFSIEDKINYIYKICNVLYELGYVKEQFLICRELYSILKKNSKILSFTKTCKIFNYISGVYIKNSILDKSREIIQKNLELCVNIEDPEILCESYFNKVILSLRENDFDKANMYINLTLFFLNKLKGKNLKEKFLNVGFIFYKLENIYKAIESFNNI